MTNTETLAPVATAYGPVCGHCSRAARVQTRHASVAMILLCSRRGSARDLAPALPVPVVTSVVDFLPPPVAEFDEPAAEVLAAAFAPAPAVTAGSVWVSSTGSLVRVRKARGSDRLLAAELVSSDEDGEWVYRGLASRVLRQLAAVPASAERVALFGHRSLSCVFCSRALDDERSLAAGYGPVCAGKFDLPWG